MAARRIVIIGAALIALGCTADAGDTSRRTDTSTAAAQSTARAARYASVIAEHDEGLLALERWRENDCATSSTHPDCPDLGFDAEPEERIAIPHDEVGAAAEAVLDDFAELPKPDDDIAELVERTRAVLTSFVDALERARSCTGGSGSCDDEVVAPNDAAAEIANVLEAWMPYLGES